MTDLILPTDEQVERAARIWCEVCYQASKEDFMSKIVKWEPKDDDWKLYRRDVFLHLLMILNKDKILGDND